MSVFADDFVLLGGQFTRCTTPPNPNRLVVGSNKSVAMPTLGRVNLTTFVDRHDAKPYGRLYHFDSQEASWYSIAWLSGGAPDGGTDG